MDLINDPECKAAYLTAQKTRYGIHTLDVVCEADIFRAGYASAPKPAGHSEDVLKMVDHSEDVLGMVGKPLEQKSFWEGFEAGRMDRCGGNIRAAWTEFTESARFKALAAPKELRNE